MADKEQENDSSKEASQEKAASGRRNFIKKMVYVAPVIETFLLADQAEAQNRGNSGSRNWRPRQNRRVSPAPTNRSARG